MPLFLRAVPALLLLASPVGAQPRWAVSDERTGTPTTLYESPDKLELNVCVTQFERLTGLVLPLEAVSCA